jgi:methylglutaconyl-CoA hydratase
VSGREQVRYEPDPDAGVAWIVLDHAEKRNALNARLVAELKECLEEAGEDDGVAVVGLRGEGPDFCAGADLQEVHDSVQEGVLSTLVDAESMGELFLQLRRTPKPVVAAVHGNALAGGAGLATACDLILMSGDARLGYPEVKLGFVPAMVMAILRRSLGEKQAFELVATGDPVDAETARDFGLACRVYPADDFREESARFVEELAGRSASALGLSKRLLYQIDGASFESGLQSGAEVNALARFTEDCRAGIRRFLED